MKSILAAIALATATLVASAAPVTLTGYQFGTAPTGTMTVNPSGLFNNQSITASVSGLTAFMNNDPFESVLLWCVEIFAPTAAFGTSAEYSVNTNPALSMYGQPFTAQQQTRLGNLFAKSFDTTFNIGGNSATESAGTQLAIWEILYDTTTGFGDLSGNLFEQIGLLDTNGFWSTGLGGARGYAEGLLSGIDTYVGQTKWDITSYSNGDGPKGGGLQNFISVKQNFGDSCQIGNDCNTVPEPGSLALIGISLIGLGLATRRYEKKRQAGL